MILEVDIEKTIFLLQFREKKFVVVVDSTADLMEEMIKIFDEHNDRGSRPFFRADHD